MIFILLGKIAYGVHRSQIEFPIEDVCVASYCDYFVFRFFTFRFISACHVNVSASGS